MNYIIFILVVLALLWLMQPARAPWREKWQGRARGYAADARNRLTEAWRKLAEAAETPAADTPAPVPALAPPAESAVPESLSARLQRLESIFGPTSHNAAHPRELAEHPQFLEAVELLKGPEVARDTVVQYALGANWGLACAALAALKQRTDGGPAVGQVLLHFDKLYPWPMYYALEYFLTVDPRPAVGDTVMDAKDWWSDNVIIPALFRDYFAAREQLGDVPLFNTAPSPANAAQIKLFLERVSHPYAQALIDQLQSLQQTTMDRTFLASFGCFWKDSKDTQPLVEPGPWLEGLMAAEAMSLEAPARSLLASGEPRVGKTAFLRLLAKRLEAKGWTVFEASGADLMAGQQWFGQLEGRIQQALQELAVTKKVIWYIPDILQIALSGTHQGQAASILDQILPALAAGRLMIWTEASPATTARLLRLRPALRSVLEVARLEPLSQEETEELAQALLQPLSDASGLEIDPACVDTALGAARQYLSAGSFPGPVLDLIKLTVGRAAKDGSPGVDSHGVILTLSQLTGLPASILDNRERVDLAAVRAYFSARVMGQDEAVSAIVERIAMLKAGLNDPGKPIGVFLFAGPTGTGKTELAKTAAEFLFGSADRLVRLDMSELQTPDSTLKILGGGEAVGGDADSLIHRVRKQPFSVVLLDEFEKAHPQVWDLFLQVFDDGRLTDALGHVADFRHCLIILTTNLGATLHRNSGLGFAPAADAYSGDNVMRTIGQTFRPEFQNRLDKVIVFHPLTRDLMRGILAKELNRVLERRGLKDREWAVEWEASAQDFLIEKGFSPEMGARPLKRAIEQYLIAPLAATIVEKRFPEGDQFVFIRSDGRAIQAEFVDPDGDSPASAVATDDLAGLPGMILAPEGTAGEVQALEGEYAGVSEALASAAWEDLKNSLSQDMLSAGFWSRQDRHETLARLALMDRVKAAMSTADALRVRLAKGTERLGRSSRELVARLALQLHLIKEGIRDVHERSPIEVGLQVEPALERTGDREATREWCARVLDMYRAWARNRHMQLDEAVGAAPGSLPLLIISGFGAHRQLLREAGLHVLEGDEGKGRGRATARVRLAVAPLGDLPAEKLRLALIEALERGAPPHAVVRRYRSHPAPLVRNMNGSWRSGKLDAVLCGDFDLIAAREGAGD